MQTDVLIVGAGPTGLMLANQLARRGVRALIIDKHSGPAQQTRALGVQARTLEIYSQLGLADRAIALGKPGTGANLWAQGRKIGRIGLGDAGHRISPYPYILILGQDDNERLLGDKLRDHGQAVQWNTELLALRQERDHVTAILRQPDGTHREITAAWVAGCDGSRSIVRDLCGIGFPGAPYEQVFFVADVEASGNMTPDELNVYLWKEGFHLFFPMRGEDHWRIVGIVPPQLRDTDEVDFEAVLPSLRGEAGTDLAFKACSWFSTYRIHHRSAKQFRERRCFLLGDAAHVHSPVGAQGMNTGLQDAYNLAWKLALVVKRQADVALLDSYEEERMPVARHLLNTTDRGFRLVVSDSPLAGLLRTQVLTRIAAWVMRHENIHRNVFRTVSQTGIHYRRSFLSDSREDVPAEAPLAGDRFPWLHLKRRVDGKLEDMFEALDDTHFHLLVFGQSLPEGIPDFGGLLQVHAIPNDADNEAALAHAGIPRTSFYLLRPDGHVGLCGTWADAAAITRYFVDRVGLRESRAAASGARAPRPAAAMHETAEAIGP